MDKWINLTALWQILVVGLLAGAGLPALVALGLVALGLRALAAPDASGAAVGYSPARVAVAALCFAIVLAAIGYGIYLIVIGGH
ncbi:MAG TPA: hypothetical protein VGG16_07460 [Streptosporangiaceae bacterium]